MVGSSDTMEITASLFANLPEGWNAKRFGDILAEPVRNGIYKKKDFHGHGAKVVNMGELFAYGFISNQKMDRIELNDRERQAYLLQDGDLLFARRSLVLEGSGKCSLVVCPSEETTFESSIIRARLSQIEADPRFYYYFWASPFGRALMASIATRTAVSGIRGSELMQLKVPIPSLLTQRKIAAVLSAYDDLIENNTRRIALLEEMARLVYHEWFVRFHFPGHESVRLVDSPLGPIPEGWEVVRLGQVADVNAETVKRGEEPEEIDYIDIASVSMGQIKEIKHFAFDDAPGRARRVVRHGGIIWSTVRPNRKSYCLILNPSPNLIISTGFAVISARQAPYMYLYHALTAEEFVGYLTNHATGSAYPAVLASDFANADILLPPKSLLEAFHNVAVDLFDKRENLMQRNALLRRTRDLLLPRLVSGAPDVSEMEIDVS